MRATKAIVSLSAIEHNVRLLGSHAGEHVALMAVVKADGYGHGALEVSKAALNAGATWLCTATMEEAVALRAAGLTAPLVVVGLLSAQECAQGVQHDIAACVFRPDQIEAMQQQAQLLGATAQAHLKIDSGFHRIGAELAQLEAVLDAFERCEWVCMQGLYTHFATADEADDSFVFEQVEQFAQAEARVKARGFDPLLHLSNSAAILRHGALERQGVRMGISLYGMQPFENGKDGLGLRPAMEWVSAIGSLRTVKAGQTVGYGRTFTATRDSLIATIPCGYADGYRRAFSNRAQVLVHGQRCNVVGRVCMDQFMVDVSEVEGVALYDEVVLMGTRGQQTIGAQELADFFQGNTHEVLTGISKRVPREYCYDK